MQKQEAFGMMDEGYFISRSEILKWVNDLLKLNVTKIESLGQGAVYCQILDAMSKDFNVPMHKVNFKAKLEYEFINNLKILQQCLQKNNVKRAIEVEKLCKCKYQDNLELIQWMKRFFESNSSMNPDYDPEARRKVQPDFGFAEKVVIPKTFGPNGEIIQGNAPDLKKRQSNPGIIEAQKENVSDNKLNEQAAKKNSLQMQKPPIQQKQLTTEQQLEKIKQILQKNTYSDSQKVKKINDVVFVKGVSYEVQEIEQKMDGMKIEYSKDQQLIQQDNENDII